MTETATNQEQENEVLEGPVAEQPWEWSVEWHIKELLETLDLNELDKKGQKLKEELHQLETVYNSLDKKNPENKEYIERAEKLMKHIDTLINVIIPAIEALKQN